MVVATGIRLLQLKDAFAPAATLVAQVLRSTGRVCLGSFIITLQNLIRSELAKPELSINQESAVCQLVGNAQAGFQ